MLEAAFDYSAVVTYLRMPLRPPSPLCFLFQGEFTAEWLSGTEAWERANAVIAAATALGTGKVEQASHYHLACT